MAVAFAITFVIFLVELVGGWWVGSLAVMADAVHMAVDLLALGMGLFAARMASRPADDKRTYGYHRVEVLAALGNGVGLWITVGVLLHEAYTRFQTPSDVKVPEMILIALIGLLANIFSAALLFRQSKHNLNVRGVLMHIISDALGSVAAVLAGVVMLLTDWSYADPLATVAICMIIAYTSFDLVRESTHILLEGAPKHVNVEEVRRGLLEIEGVEQVHDLHLWTLSSGNDAMSGHLVVAKEKSTQDILKAGARFLEGRFKISHSTLQIEKGAAAHHAD
jgi:cobalt-zinc-cadmium efflux system protein